MHIGTQGFPIIRQIRLYKATDRLTLPQSNLTEGNLERVLDTIYGDSSESILVTFATNPYRDGPVYENTLHVSDIGTAFDEMETLCVRSFGLRTSIDMERLGYPGFEASRLHECENPKQALDYLASVAKFPEKLRTLPTFEIYRFVNWNARLTVEGRDAKAVQSAYLILQNTFTQEKASTFP